MISFKFSCREFLGMYSTKEPHQSQKWAIRRPFSWVGDDFVQYFMSRVSWDQKYKRATSFTEVSYLETIFMSGRWFRPNFHVEIFYRSIGQNSHINHRSDLSGDHFLEWAMISFKFSCREFLGMYSTKEPHQSQKWAIRRPFSWVGDDFVQYFMSRVSWDQKYKRAISFTEVSYLETIFMSGRWFRPNFHDESFFRCIVQNSHINHRSELSGDHFHEWAMILSKFSCREFFEIYSTKEHHQSQKWAIWRPFSWVGGDFVQSFMSRVSWDIKYKRATSITEMSYLETIFMVGRWFRPIFLVESFFGLIVQKSHFNHRTDLSGDHFLEWAMISFNFSCREFLGMYSTKEPHQSQKWAIWRPFSWVGDVSSKFSCLEFLEIYSTKEPHQSQKWAIWRPFSWVGDDFVQVFLSRVFWDL